MEIRINDFTLNSGYITGVIGDYKSFLRLFDSEMFLKNSISLNKKRLNNLLKKDIFKKVSIINNDVSNDYLSLTVNEYMRFYIFNNNLKLKDYKKKIKDSLKIVGLPENYLDRKIDALSSYERKILEFSISLLSNPDILIFNNFFNGIDLKNQKKLISLLNQLVEKYQKIVVICSNDSELIYRITKILLIFMKDEFVLQDYTDNMFEKNTDFLLKYGISIPKTILFTNLVYKEKNVKLNYNKDIRDLIKDIYKKV